MNMNIKIACRAVNNKSVGVGCVSYIQTRTGTLEL